MSETQGMEAGLSERLLMSAVDMERMFLHRIDHSGEDWRLVNPNGEAAAALMREAQAVLSAAEAERDALQRKLDLHEAALAFVHRWAVQKEGNGTSAEERMSAIAHHPAIQALSGTTP